MGLSRGWTRELVSVCSLLLLSFSGTVASADSGNEFFENRIRPALVEHCYACHNSSETAEGGLVVDYRDGLRKGGDGGTLVVPGDASASRLIAILKHEIDGLEMPQDGPKLDDRVIQDFERWIVMGAPDPRDQPPTAQALVDATSWDATLKRRLKWWSFQPIQKVSLPAPSDWSDHPVDRFVAAKLREVNLRPVEQVDSQTLIRRLFINLIGMPPRPDELKTWTSRYGQAGNSGRDKVTERLVDELLASRHFGERWARHWMDWIRYAESHGSEGDPRIENAWMYRDYLIRALNADVPYDQLIREHVAGDLLPEPRINDQLGINESMIGPAHWRMVFHGFAPTDALDEKVRFVDDQINAFSKAFLGMTVSCARCHNHKFDAISQADYYALFAILGSCRPARNVIDVRNDDQNRGQLQSLKGKIRHAVAADWLRSSASLADQLLALDVPEKDAKDKSHAFALFFRMRPRASSGKPFAEAWKQAMQSSESELAKASREGILRQWNLTHPEDYQEWTAYGVGLPSQPHPAGEFSVSIDGDQALADIYPAGVYSHLLTAKDPARLTSRDFTVGENQELWVRVIGGGNSSLRYVVQDYPRNGTVYPVTNLQSQWKWQRYNLTYWQGDQVHIELSAGKDAPLLVKGDDRSWFGVTEARLTRRGTPPPSNRWDHRGVLLGSNEDHEPESIEDLARLYASAIRKAVEDWRGDGLTDDQAELLRAGMVLGLLPNSLVELPTARSLIEQYRRHERDVISPTRVPGLEETVGRKQRLFVRGNHKQPADVVPRRFLEAIDPKPYETGDSGRLKLAEDVLRDDNPLTRRVIVNRIWHHLFGRGIVATPDNLGRLGSQPSHPEMLDWLANRFAQDGWSLKRMIRLLVTSRTWQLDSTGMPAAQELDPGNQFLSHANVRRMEAEVIRDALLSVSGRLDRRSFGPPVDGNTPRRSVYVSVIRNSLDSFLRVFDFPEPFSTTGRRDVTNVPAQSLTMMNDPSIAQYAAALAASMVGDDQLTSDSERINRLYVTALSRLPSAVELEKATGYLAASRRSQLQLRERVAALNEQISQQQKTIAGIIEPVRRRLVQQAEADTDVGQSNLPEPIGQWEFDGDLRDRVGKAHAAVQGDANVEAGQLVVSGGYAVTKPLDHSLTEKTLEAWVKLDRLNQRGGGVITVQTPDGVFFDSIVFGERDPMQWMSGSNNFARTEGFEAPQESEATKRLVHVAIAYHSDGRVVGYRDGKPYGRSYKSNGPYQFKAGKTLVSFGVRHLPAGGNRMLAGAIDRAAIYDRALSAEEVAATASGLRNYVSESQVMAALTDQQRGKLKQSEETVNKLREELESLGDVPDSFGDRELWTDFARAIFNLKEFVYVR